MAKIIGLPKLSPTMEEGVLLEWAKKEGDAVEIDDLLAEVETDKATMEFRSFDKGVLLKILIPAGESAAPDTPVAIIGKAGEDISELLAEVASRASASAATPAESAPVAAAPVAAAPVAAAPVAAAPVAAAPVAAAPVRADGERAFASPLVRRLAREQSIDLATIHGSGPRGRIIKRDLEGASAAPSSAVASSGSFQRLPPRVEKASATRKTIARRLTESKQTVPHFYLTIDVDAGPLVAARKMMNSALDGDKVSFNDIIIKAAAMALRKFPKANASWMGDTIHYHQVVDISVAVAIDEGLVTPVVRDADRLGVLEISHEVRELAGKARDKKLRLEEMSGGTFSISNLGMFGVEEFAAVINPPEGALLAVGALRDAPIVRDGQVVAGKKMKVTLSCDHRVVDGAVGAQWLQVFQRYIEAPMSMLL
ncbi:MAG: pyruvate dehydrogenase E2 component (dihydrolipoamide acetyltransferase) [Polyangiales bacterium]|jgi:pyruvate dehydrogenase E2 component (dihydrolipoamide acetyltransferase)